MKRSLLVTLILVFAIYGTTGAAFWVTSVKTATIYPSKDSYSWQSNPNANNGHSDNFEIASYEKEPFNMRGWIEFNINSVPKDVWVISADLRLRVWTKYSFDPSTNRTGDSTGRVYGVYRLTQPWNETGVNWTNQPNYTDEQHVTAAVPAGKSGWYGPLLWMDWDVTDIVKDWRSGVSNYGLVVKDTNEYSPAFYTTQFFTHDQVPNTSYYPRLLVTYVSPLAIMALVIIMLLEGVLITTFLGMRSKRSKTRK